MSDSHRLLVYANQRGVLYTSMVMGGDLSKLTPRQRRRFYKKEFRNLTKMIRG